MRIPLPAFRYAPLATFVAVAVLLSFAVQRSGHFWGDDFALYIRQSKGLIDGNWPQVVADNHFAVDNSAWHTFSPYSYPWGFPLLLSPFVWQWGVDYDQLKLLGTICFAVFLVFFNRIAERRIGYGPALALTAAIGCSLAYLGQTNTVQSEMPFLAFIGLSLWLIDRATDAKAWEGERHARLVVLGLVLAFTFNIRREGLAVVVALAAAHAVHLLTRQYEGTDPWWRQVDWKRLLRPYTTFLVAVAAFQLVLPSVLIPQYEGAGFQNLRENLSFFRPVLAEQLSFNRPYRPQFEVFGSVGFGEFVFWTIVVLAALGLLVRLALRWRDDAPLIAYLVAMAAAIARLPFHESRYLLSLTPFILYFAAQALPTIMLRSPSDSSLALPSSGEADSEPTQEAPAARSVGAASDDSVEDDEDSRPEWLAPISTAWPYRVAVAIVVVGLAGITLLGFSAARGEADRVADAHGAPQWGPTDPSAIEMWAAVEQYTRPDDVVAFFRARLMTLETDRRSIQSGGLPVIMKNADYYAMARNSTYSQPDVSDEAAAESGLVKVWENNLWVLWRVPDPEPAAASATP